MLYRSKWIIAVTLVFGLVMFIPMAQAEQIVDWTQCVSGTATIASATKELTVFSIDAKGIIISNLENKLFDNMTSHCIGIRKVMAGQTTSLTYSKFMDLDGDFVILETAAAPGEKEGTFKFLQGTGKWKGIKGGGKIRAITRGKAIIPGTGQTCYKATGTFELPK